jgi:hypothetical protein
MSIKGNVLMRTLDAFSRMTATKIFPLQPANATRQIEDFLARRNEAGVR